MLAAAAFAANVGGLEVVLPVPLGVLVALHGLPAGLGAAAAFLAAWGFLTKTPAVVLASAGALLSGLVYGVGLRRAVPPGRIILLGAAAVAGGEVPWQLPVLAEAWNRWRAGMAEGAAATLDFYRNSGLLATVAGHGVDPEEFRVFLDKLATHFGRLFPAVVGWELLAAAALAYFLCRWLAGRRLALAALPPFWRWQIPWPFAWGFIGGLAAFLCGDWRGNDVLLTVGENVLVGYVPLLLVSGLAVAGYLYRYLALPPFVKAAGVLAALLYWPLGAAVVLLLGLFDPLLNFRRIEIHGGENR